MVFVGSWVSGKKNGYGVQQLDNNVLYKGEFKDDHKCGDGIFVIGNGLKVKGKFLQDNLIEECVTIQFPNEVVYKGEIRNMRLNGCGRLHFDDQTTF